MTRSRRRVAIVGDIGARLGNPRSQVIEGRSANIER
jgi:hypothetical protein